MTAKLLAPVVQTLDSTIHWINHYPLDNSIGFASVYPLDSDLSGGHYPSFEQLGPGHVKTDITFQVVTMVFQIFPRWSVTSVSQTYGNKLHP